MFKTEPESETDVYPMYSDYIQNVLRRRMLHDTTFDVYEVDVDGSFNIGSPIFKYNDKHVFVDGECTRQRRFCGNCWQSLILIKSRHYSGQRSIYTNTFAV